MVPLGNESASGAAGGGTADDQRALSATCRDPRLTQRLAGRLAQPLPGAAAQAPFQPELSYGRYFGPPPGGARSAAVLVLLYPQAAPASSGADWCLPLTLRPAHLLDHAGQISLPGGAVEPGESSERAALRELDEELGVGTADLEMLGELSPIYLFRSNFLIQPWLAARRTRPSWQPNRAEVAELLEVPLAALCDRSARRIVERRQGSWSLRAPAFVWGGHEIWARRRSFWPSSWPWSRKCPPRLALNWAVACGLIPSH